MTSDVVFQAMSIHRNPPKLSALAVWHGILQQLRVGKNATKYKLYGVTGEPCLFKSLWLAGACWRCQCEPWRCIIPSCHLMFQLFSHMALPENMVPQNSTVPWFIINLPSKSVIWGRPTFFRHTNHLTISEARLSSWHPAGLSGQLGSWSMVTKTTS